MPPFVEDHDVAIIGSGPMGATYARVVCDKLPDAKVLLVEAGPVVANPPGLHVSNIFDSLEREKAQIASQGPNQFRYELPATSGTAINVAGAERARALVTRPGMFAVGSGDIDGDGFPAAQESCNVGGMGSHWFGACPRPGKLEKIDFVDAEALERAFLQAERFLQVTSTQFQESRFAKHVQKVVGEQINERRTPDRRVQPMPMAVKLTSRGVFRAGPNVILGHLLSGKNKNFELRPNTLCERVTMENGRAIGVQLRDRETGVVTAVRAKYVVIAGDSLRTPQLLFASGIRPKALGHYLNEHPQVSVMAEVEGLGPDTVHDDISGNATAMSDSKAVAIASSGVTWIPYEGEEFEFSAMLVQINPDTVARSEKDRKVGNPLISVHLFGIQDLRYENWLEFSETEKDWIGMPAMKIHFSLSKRDLERLDRGKSEVLRISHMLGKPVDGEEPWILPAGSSLHYQGTVRMGLTNDGTSVCDKNCRVWDTENVYVAGNGVIPTTTACNPTLTSMALAIIGANDILTRLSAAQSWPSARALNPVG
ncbi:MAG TPA: GMC oxidoreductase [Candidatus Acidoferrum sp.]|nr:GMC oxidoreductase [Candidatus Acidoferrum sp.]